MFEPFPLLHDPIRNGGAGTLVRLFKGKPGGTNVS